MRQVVEARGGGLARSRSEGLIPWATLARPRGRGQRLEAGAAVRSGRLAVVRSDRSNRRGDLLLVLTDRRAGGGGGALPGQLGVSSRSASLPESDSATVIIALSVRSPHIGWHIPLLFFQLFPRDFTLQL